MAPDHLDDAELDPRHRPQDDLFAHVNQRWIDETPIPSDRAAYGTFYQLADEAERASRALLESCVSADPGTLERQLGDLYGAFMDEAAIDALGVTPVAPRLAAVAALRSMTEWGALVGSLTREGLAGVVSLFVDTDPGDPERYRVFLEQGGLSLPDESYYREERFAAVREAFAEHVARVLALAGLDDAVARARRVMELETAIAAGHWDAVASRDVSATYNPRAIDDVVGDSAALRAWRDALEVPAGALDEVVVRQPSFVTSLVALLDESRLASWRDWLAWRVVLGDARYLSSDVADAHFDFYGRTLTGAPSQRERWKRAVGVVESAMGDALGRLYVAHHFPPSAKGEVEELVANLVAAYREAITGLTWMGEATRERALAKLDAFTPKIGYPARWRDYGALEVRRDDLVGSVHAAEAVEFDRQMAKIAGPVDRDEWFMTPQTVNAYYNPGMNEIVFPAAILQPPFFEPGGDDAANYGAIGAVIGHEIGHGFDDQGSRFDGVGRLVDWWEPADRAAFEERTRALIDQYDALSPAEAPDQHVNGALTIGENIGDLGGLGIAWRAYRLSRRDAADSPSDTEAAARRFFVAWARAWRFVARPEEVVRRLAIDPHSPPVFRCNQVAANLDVFHEAFATAPGDGLWLDADQRVTIW